MNTVPSSPFAELREAARRLEEQVARDRAAEDAALDDAEAATASDDAPLRPRVLRQPRGVLARDVEPERVSWLWPGRLAEGKVTVQDGDPGLGKSTETLDIAARITTGAPLPGCTSRRSPRGVVILSAEDGAADTIVPRLEAAGADTVRIFIMDGVVGSEAPVTLPRDLDAVERAIIAFNAALLIVDPLMAYLGADTNAHRDQDVRRALAPLAAMLERTGCAGLLVRHLNKMQASVAMYRGGGSIGIIGAARFGLLVARDPDDDEARILAPIKCNIGPPPPALRFYLRSVPGSDVARVEWDPQPATIDAAGLLAASDGSDEDRSAVAEAVEWLKDQLNNGARPAGDLLKASRKDGIAERTLRRAKSLLGVRSERSEGDAGWRWALVKAANDAGLTHVGNVGSLGNVAENPQSSAEMSSMDGCQHGQGCQGCQHCQPLGRGHLAPTAGAGVDRIGERYAGNGHAGPAGDWAHATRVPL
jgi:hypothetical protein